MWPLTDYCESCTYDRAIGACIILGAFVALCFQAVGFIAIGWYARQALQDYMDGFLAKNSHPDQPSFAHPDQPPYAREYPDLVFFTDNGQCFHMFRDCISITKSRQVQSKRVCVQCAHQGQKAKRP